jgi:hypothetical protein
MYFKDPEYMYLHREDGPAIVFENGDEAWYLDGLMHRVDGPALKNVDGSEDWY